MFDNNQFQPTGSVVSPTPQDANVQAAVTQFQNDQDKKHRRSIAETIVLTIVSVIAAVFIGLFVWMFLQYNDARTDVEGQIREAVAVAVDQNTMKLNEEFAEKEKSPYNTFLAPGDYGGMTFDYPKTWSVYIAKEADKGGDFEAYLNPDKVSPVKNDAINALRVTIKTGTIEDVVKQYDRYVQDGTTTASVRQINGENANVYAGTLQNKLVGKVAIFKIRDKVVTLQTDASVFISDFDKILDTVKYNR